MISKQTDEAEALAREAKTKRTGRQPGTRRLGAEVCTATSERTKSEDHQLMERVAREVSDARVLKLIRRFLEAGMMSDGLVEPRTQGTPQGGPLWRQWKRPYTRAHKLRSLGLDAAADAAATPASSLNRRMRNRTYGGVGGG